MAAAEQLQNTKNDFTGVTSGLRSVEELMAGDLRHASRGRVGGAGLRGRSRYDITASGGGREGAGQRIPAFGHAFTSCSLCLCLQVYFSSVCQSVFHLYSD